MVNCDRSGITPGNNGNGYNIGLFYATIRDTFFMFN